MPGSGPDGGSPREPGSGHGYVGTVAEEAARLVDALAARFGESARAERSATTTTDAAPDPGPADTAAPDAEPEMSRCPTCGGPATSSTPSRDSSTPITCAVCPVCQGLALLRTLSPETMDRLADLAAVAVETLRDLATTTRRAARQDDDGVAGDDGGGNRGRGRRTVIPVTDDDAPADPVTDEDAPS